MRKWLKMSVLSVTMMTAFLAPLCDAAAAGGRHHQGYYYGEGQRGGYHRGYQRPHHDRGEYRRAKRHRRGDAVAAGIIGLGIGAIIGSALAQPASPPAPVYRRQQPAYRAPQSVYGSGTQPWSPGWYAYCTRTYRSFNSNTGTFRGYDGRDHFCVAR